MSARGGSALGSAFLAFGSVIFIGALTMLIVDSLGKYLNNEEYFAARAVSDWKAQHPGWQPHD